MALISGFESQEYMDDPVNHSVYDVKLLWPSNSRRSMNEHRRFYQP
jgi:hypothetical protein